MGRCTGQFVKLMWEKLCESSMKLERIRNDASRHHHVCSAKNDVVRIIKMSFVIAFLRAVFFSLRNVY